MNQNGALSGYVADSFASGSGSSKTISTDNSSRHSNASTTPSSTDLSGQDDWRQGNKKSSPESNSQSTPKANPTSILKSGRSWSFGGSKKNLSPATTDEGTVPATPAVPDQYKTGRARATTTSTDATVTPPQLEQDVGFDLGGSFSKMFMGFDKRSSAMTLRDESGRQVLQPAAPLGARSNAPAPLNIDKTTTVEPPPHSWASHRSNDELLMSDENTPPPVPKHAEAGPSRPRGLPQSASDSLIKRTSAIFSGRRKSNIAMHSNEGDDLDSALLAVNRFMTDDNSRSTTPIEATGGRPRVEAPTSASGYRVVMPKTAAPKNDLAEDDGDDDNIFDNIPLNNSLRMATPRQQPPPQTDTPAQHKVMTPSEFERYRKDKEFESRRAEVEEARERAANGGNDDEEDNYDDEEDDVERSKELAKQRRKQEAHMSVYRQQMMKVTGESADMAPLTRPGMQMSLSTPNLTVPESLRNPSSDVSEDDEEVPLAILAAHGFPNKNRPPTRLTNMMSNPNLRQASQPSYQRPGSAAGQVQTGNGPLPPFARGLPQDPYGLVNAPVRETFGLGGGVPAGQASPVPPGGLVGVIANEERARSMRRGTPQVAAMDSYQNSPAMGPGGFDPVQGIPPQMMYPQAMQMQMQNMMLSPGEQAQIQLSQQMSQFMQMQMQFMQMMAGNNNNPAGAAEPPRSAGHLGSQSVGAIPGMSSAMGMHPDMNPGARASFLDPGAFDSSRGDVHNRTMSLVQPSSSSWLQPPQPGYAGSIRGQGNGYTPSIAPSERSNVGLPGRYRPVSSVPTSSATPDNNRTSYASGGGPSPLGAGKTLRIVESSSPGKKVVPKDEADDDDEEGWAAMKAKRDQKKSSWRVRKTLAPGEIDIGSLIT